MLIDIHVHTRKYRSVTRSNGTRYPVAEELIAMMDERGINKAVVLCSMSPEHASVYVVPDEVVELCARYPRRLIPFCNVDPRMLENTSKADFRPMMKWYKDAGCKGIGEYVPNIPFDDPMNMNVFRQAEEVRLPITFHIAPKIGGYYGCYDELGLPRLEKVLKSCPKLLMFGHSQPFWSEISADNTEEKRNTYPVGKVKGTGRVVRLMRKYPNLYGDLSAGSGLNAVSRDLDFGIKFMEEFQDRLFFGTDICNIPQDTPAIEFFAKLKKEKLISKEAYEKITWRNADRVLGLGLSRRRKRAATSKRKAKRGRKAPAAPARFGS